jgi:hypothetical protein
VPRLRCALLVVAVGVLASGCGGSEAPSAQQFERSVNATRDRVDDALARITQAQSKDELLERMDEATSAIDDAAGDLEGTGTPKGYESEADSLAESMHQLAFDVQATADQIRQPGFGDLLTGTRGLSFESWDKVNLALARLKAQGIEVAPLERH